MEKKFPEFNQGNIESKNKLSGCQLSNIPDLLEV